MPSLMLNCRGCRQEFPSGIGVTEEAMHGVTMSSLHHRCPHCGVEEEYFTQDYHAAMAAGDTQEVRGPEANAPELASRKEEASRMAAFGVGA